MCSEEQADALLAGNLSVLLGRVPCYDLIPASGGKASCLFRCGLLSGHDRLVAKRENADFLCVVM